MTAFGLTPSEADNTIRISLCPQNTAEDAAALLTALQEGGRRLRR
jgi:cysteine sulfinate desulfinase/cysteine desulfurase-like protein